MATKINHITIKGKYIPLPKNIHMDESSFSFMNVFQKCDRSHGLHQRTKLLSLKVQLFFGVHYFLKPINNHEKR